MVSEWVNSIHQGDAEATLAKMPESSVHMAMCSPPYFGLRDYGVDGQIGLEESLQDYISNLVDVGREFRRVLRPDGSWWLNLGDSYAGGRGMAGVPDDHQSKTVDHSGDHQSNTAPLENAELGRKNKMLVPYRVAIALQEDGWIVRNDVTWVKPGAMPSSVKDRLNTTTERVFHLTPNPDYWYDLDAIREPHTSRQQYQNPGEKRDRTQENNSKGLTNHELGINDQHPKGKNPGDVFEITTKPFPEAHFAVYPPELCEKPIKATCPPEVCSGCGTPYERQQETVDRPDRRDRDKPRRQYKGNTGDHNNRISWVGTPKDVVDEWWEKDCSCATDNTKSGIVIDPFAGSGTTCKVAKDLGRRFMGIDLNEEYVAMAQKRVGIDVDQPELLLEDGETALTAYTDGGSAE